MNYTQYIEDFNRGDDERLVEQYFTEDCIFQSGNRLLRGRSELLGFLHWAHDGIREIIRAQLVLQDATHIFAEIDMDFHATRDRPDFLFGALKQGEFLTVKFFVIYRLREGKVAHLKSAIWPTNVGVSKPATRLGASPQQRQAFLAYTQAFSNAQLERFSQYYTDDVVCELGGAGIVLRGKQAILDFYGKMFQTVRESLTLHQLIADEDGLAADVTSQFTAIEDAQDFVVAPLRKGECVRVRVLVYYSLRDGRISHIRVGRAGPVSAPQRA
jgi:ketosteroid isomerase-like protein